MGVGGHTLSKEMSCSVRSPPYESGIQANTLTVLYVKKNIHKNSSIQQQSGIRPKTVTEKMSFPIL